MELKWTRAALHDLDAAGAFLAQRNPRAASRMAARLEEAALVLRTYPTLGRPGRLRETREVVVSGTPLLLIYRVRAAQVQVLRVLHHSRRWP